MIIEITRPRPLPPPPREQREKELLEEMIKGIKFIARHRTPPIIVE